MELSVVILNYNVKFFLELCLKSVEQAITEIDAEIIVVDNNSSDGSCEMVKQKFPSVELISNQNNVGFAKANNQGVKAAKGEYICILNPDTVVAEDTFLQLLEFAKTKSDLGAVGCKLIDGSGHFLPESKRNLPVVKVALQKMFGNGKNYYANQINKNEIAKVEVLVGAFMLMKKDTYNQVNGFDEDYFMYGEDIDLSYKLLQSGFQNYYYGKTTCIHYKGESTNKDKIYTKRFYKAMKLFYKKHFKTNVFFDAFVLIGINFAHLFKRKSTTKPFRPSQYYFISNVSNKALETVLTKNIHVQNHVKDIKPKSEVIFDANSLTYKEIINNFENLHAPNNLSFKILPKHSNFILGSNDAVNRGEVIQFHQN
ncbi:MAG: glycosyltransferase family 2 protein [Flavobacteriaceae bacterium]|nr:glycosyltransferase family 2 protein [Flavobacteriaceae bacterium]